MTPSELVARYARGTKKRLGQHFLVDPSSLARVCDAGQVRAGERVLEIGPGCGTLTSAMLERGAHITALEIDRDAVAFLRATFAGAPLEVLERDATRVDYAELICDADPIRCVSNLPYNVGSLILRRLALSKHLFSRLALMFQHEVALRLAARPGDGGYAALSVLVQLDFEVRYDHTVSPRHFRPPPKVESGVVVLTPRSAPAGESQADRQRLERLVRQAFSKRRKTLRNALKGSPFGPGPLSEFLEESGRTRTARAEELGLEDFRALSRRYAP